MHCQSHPKYFPKVINRVSAVTKMVSENSKSDKMYSFCETLVLLTNWKKLQLVKCTAMNKGGAPDGESGGLSMKSMGVGTCGSEKNELEISSNQRLIR
jgi:hypothetical protein